MCQHHLLIVISRQHVIVIVVVLNNEMNVAMLNALFVSLMAKTCKEITITIL